MQIRPGARGDWLWGGALEAACERIHIQHAGLPLWQPAPHPPLGQQGEVSGLQDIQS
jgi:hypothetical protein